MRTLEQIEPRSDVNRLAGTPAAVHVISQPGSYYLTANVEVDRAVGILISARNVSLDLNGFEIFKTDASATTGILVSVPGSSPAMCHVFNGTMNGSFNKAVDASSSDGNHFEALNIRGATSGIDVRSSSLITDCVVETVTDELSGLRGSLGCVFINNTDTSTESKVQGSIAASLGAVVHQCRAPGFVLEEAPMVSDCTATVVLSGTASRIDHCRAGAILTGAASVITETSASSGISTGTGSVIASCEVHHPDPNSPQFAFEQSLIVTGDHSVVSDCSVKPLPEIIASHCVVLGNGSIFADSSIVGWRASPNAGPFGIFGLSGGSHLLVTDAVITHDPSSSGNERGIYMAGPGLLAEGCTIAAGVSISTVDESRIANSTLSGLATNATGSAVSLLTGNTLFRPFQSGRSLVEKNTLHLDFGTNSGLFFRKNLILADDWGIEVGSSSRVDENHVCASGLHAIVVGGSGSAVVRNSISGYTGVGIRDDGSDNFIPITSGNGSYWDNRELP